MQPLPADRQKNGRPREVALRYGADRGSRTPNLLITNQLHCQLCYVGLDYAAPGVNRSSGQRRILCNPKGDGNLSTNYSHGTSFIEVDPCLCNIPLIFAGLASSPSLKLNQK